MNVAKRKPRSEKKNITKSQIATMINSALKSGVGHMIEMKYWAVTTTLTNVNSSGNIVDLSLIPQGDTDSSRDGDQCFLKKVSCRFAFWVGTASTKIRAILVQWFPNNVPSVTSILLGSASTQAPLIGYNRDNEPMYRVISDWTSKLIPASTDSVQVHKFVHQIPQKFASAQYIAGTTAGTNHLYLVTLSDVTAATLPQYEQSTRLDFYD